MRFEVYQTIFAGRWRWRLRARNWKIIATSGEAFWNESDCLDSIGLVQQAVDAKIHMPAFKVPK